MTQPEPVPPVDTEPEMGDETGAAGAGPPAGGSDDGEPVQGAGAADSH